MSEPVEVTTVEPLVSPATLSPPELAVEMPQLMLSLLERRYLTDFQPALWRMAPAVDDASRPLLREVISLGRPDAREDWAQAMPSVLTACHELGQTVVMAVHGDGRRHRIHVGARRTGPADGSTLDFLESQSSALRAHVRGLRLGPTTRLDGDELPELSTLLQEATALAVLTGIPTPRGNGGGLSPFQRVDRLVEAMGEHRYALVVVAEPLAPGLLDNAVDQCRRLQGDVHSLVRRTLSQGETEGTSGSTTTDETDESESRLPAYLIGTAAFCSAAGLLVPLVAPAAATGSAALLLSRLAGLAQPAMIGAGLARAGAAGPRSSVTTGHSRSTSRTASAEVLDAGAAACEALLQQHERRLQAARAGGWWRTSVYLAAESDTALGAMSGALRGICSGDGAALDPIRILRPLDWLVRSAALGGQTLHMEPVAAVPGHPLGQAFDALATCMSSEELSVLVNLPHRDLPGLPLRDVGEFSLTAPPPAAEAVTLGSVVDGAGRALDELTVTPDAINRHVLITGMTGYGKSTSAQNLLLGSYAGLGVPFTVIEPVKGEYRALADAPELRGRLRVYTIGAEPGARHRSPWVMPLRLNPFAPVADVPLSRHIDLLKAVFNASFPMFAGMSYILEEAMLQVYTERGWDLYDSSNDVLGPTASDDDVAVLVPSIGDLYAKIEVVLKERDYGREVHQNLGAALRSRLKSLMVGTKGMALDTRRSSSPEALFGTPCVIELRNLGDDEEKAFVMALLLVLLYEYAESRLGVRKPGGERLRHVTLIEEAHRLLRASRGPAGQEAGDPQAKAVSMFTDMLAEMRSYGEGFVVADQVPTKLAPEVLKNSNLKILHRLVAPDDRAAVGSTINLSDSQSRHLATLPPGTAIVHDERIGAAVQVHMAGPAALRPGAAPSADRAGQDADRSYLRLNGACRHCPAPCEFLHRSAVAAASEAADRAMAGVLAALLLGDVEGGWRRWSDWRVGLPAAGESEVGVPYCGASQAVHRWLQRTASARRAATGTTSGPQELLDEDRTARRVARWVLAWCEAAELDAGAVAAAGRARDELVALLGTAPPRELAGCTRCPARCRMLALVAAKTTTLSGPVAARASAGTPADSRVRSLFALQDPVGDLDVSLSERDRAALWYCAVTVAAPDTAPDDDVLTALRTAAIGPGEAAHRS